MRTNLRSTTLLVALLGSQSIGAATITVTSTADSGSGTLRAALLTANNGDMINFALPTPSRITLTSGELVISKGVTVLGPGPSNLLVDGGGRSRVFRVSASNAVTIIRLTITNGYSGSFDRPGAGLYNPAAILTVSNCVFVRNNTINGGALFNAGRLQLINSSVKDNTAFNGGGLSNAGGTALITNCLFTGNFVEDGNGGAILNDSDSRIGTVWITRSVLSNNFAGSGGAIANYAFAGTASVFVVQSSINSNAVLADIGWGGGIYNQAFGNQTRANIAITDSTIAGNVAGEGGGIKTHLVEGSTYLGITNSTISGNTAICVSPEAECSGLGGGIFDSAIINPGTGVVYVVNSTLAGNRSQYASGIIAESTGLAAVRVVVASTIFDAGPSNGPIFRLSPLLSSSAVLTTLGYSICSDSGSGFLTNATDHISTDPALGPLQNNGGPTLTHAPLPGSPAIDRGRNFSGSTQDQRGLPRTIDMADILNATGGDGTDIGAVETQDAGLRFLNFGVVSNQFGFDLIGSFTNVVVEASTNVAANWSPLTTNALSNGVLRFSDPSAESPRRFYRAYAR